MIEKSIYIKTFGCQMNVADSLKLEDIFQQQGYNIIVNEQNADIIIYNTCSVREHAEQKALSHIGRLKFLKEKKPTIKICIVGCMSQRIGNDIKKKFPYVDIIVGPSAIFDLPKLIKKEVFAQKKSSNKYENKRGNTLSSYIPIMRGCNNFCSYCIVPYVRGREQYRSVNDIIVECKILVQKNIKEIILLGQSVNSHPDFCEILKIVATIKGIKKVRFLTSYPAQMNKKIIDIVADNSVIYKDFHIPVQSGSNKILKKMNRKYTINEFRKIARYIRKKIPAASITSDFIVGFPCESEKDFQMTLDIIGEIEFDNAFTFKYSPRPMTSASKLKDDIPLKVKKERLAYLNKLCKEVSLKRNKLLEGKIIEVFAGNKNSGRSNEYKLIFFNNSDVQAGEDIKVKITAALPNSLKGECV